MNTKKKLNNSLSVSCILFACCLSLAIGSVGYIIYRNSMYRKFNEYVTDILTYADYGIDNQKIADAIDSETWNDECQALKDRLDDIKETHKLEFIYLVRPLNYDAKDNMMNIMVGETNAEKEQDNATLFLTLTGDAYPQKVVGYYMDRMDGSNHISFYTNRTEWGEMYTGLLPILDASGKTSAILCVDIKMGEIRLTLGYFILFILLGAFIITGIFLFHLLKWMSKRIVTPLIMIEKSAIDFVDSSQSSDNINDLEYKKPDIHTEDEIEELSVCIDSMARDLKKYMIDLTREISENERINTELNLATMIQESSLPHIFPPYPECTEFDIYATMNPAKEVGGDFYDFFMIDKNHMGITIADVSGKGIPAALFMMISMTLIKNQAYSTPSPKAVLEEVNNQLCASNSAEMFVTVWFGILELSTGRIVAANGGHEYPVIKRAGGQFELYKDRHGLALACMEGVRYKEYEIFLNPGDAIFIYTDGVPEATDANNMLFGTDRMVAALNMNPEAAPRQLLENVHRSVDEFVGDAPQFDDLTMLSLHYKGI